MWVHDAVPPGIGNKAQPHQVDSLSGSLGVECLEPATL
jgi:hypothetical protein